jgi:crossover junction endodeoxyribonuclease RuvC
MAAVLEKHKPQLAAMETLFFSRNVTSALGVAEARGILSLACYQHGIVLKEYSPNMLKQTVTGMARADKVQVQEMVRFLLGLADIPKPDHAADALAAAICAANYEELITK